MGKDKTNRLGGKNVRFNRNKAFLVSIALVLLLTLLAACSKSGSGGNTSETAGSGTAGGAAADAAKPEAGAGAIDPMAKSNPPVAASFGVIIKTAVAPTFTEDKWENSAWIKAYSDQLGVNIKPAWFAQQGDTAQQKISVVIASGQIPDIMAVDKDQLAALSKTDLIWDLKDVYEKYTTPLTKSIMTEEGDTALRSATFDGKLLALPETDSAIDGAPFLWIRQDWLDQLKLPVPKTTDELYQVIQAFVNNKLGDKGKTVGLLLNKNFLDGGQSSALGIFNAFDAYPSAWVRGNDGKLVYGSVQPEVKDALAYLHRLYADGYIEKDFGAKDPAKVAEVSAAGQAGVQFGQMWNGSSPLQATKDNFPNSDWRAYPIVSKDNKPANPQIKLAVNSYYVVSKKFAHPEALPKIMNFFTNLNYGNTPKEVFDQYMGTGAVGHHYAVARTWKSQKNLQAHLSVVEAVKSGDISKLNPEQKGYYDRIKGYKEGNNSMANTEKIFGETGAFSAMELYVNQKLFMKDQFYGASTDSMKKYMTTIDQNVLEYYTKVIMGSDSIDNFDKFVEQLNKLGLQDITKEVNDWDASMK